MTGRAVRRSGERILAALLAGEGRVEAGEPAVLRILGEGRLTRLRIDRAEVGRLVAAGLLARRETAGVWVLRLTAEGRAHVARATGGADAFRLQHGEVSRRPVEAQAPPLLVDEAESPLARLAKRRDKDGRAYFGPSRLEAGERLRADFTLARMMPTVTSNWSFGRAAAGGVGPGGLADLTDRALAARDRVRAALDAVGADLADVLLDVCCFLKGLETIESDRRWPARSAKVVLDIALGRLAAHYGLAEEARGPARGGHLRAWGTADHRPTIGPPHGSSAATSG